MGQGVGAYKVIPEREKKRPEMDVVKDVYLKECNSSMSISSNFAHLEIKSCTKTKVIFKLK